MVGYLEISGHRHFQYLQDSVFRTYADLKRDPATAKDTIMYFHNPKDDEHWRVVPERFTLERSKDKRTLYYYNIELTVVGPADSTVELDFDDKNILDQLNNVFHTVNMAQQLMAGALNDLTALSADIGTVLSNVTVMYDGLTNVVTATDDFLNGVENTINVPHSWVVSFSEFLEAQASIGSDPDLTPDPYQTVTLPDSVTNTIRRAVEGLELLAVNPSVFETPNNTTMSEVRDKQDINRSVPKETRDAATSPSSFRELEMMGTSLTAGEVTAAGGVLTAGGEVVQYRSLQKVEIGLSDTLTTLAAKHLGDGRLWQYIAIANGLKPPYVDNLATLPLLKSDADEVPFTHALGRGGSVLVPTNVASSLDYPNLPVLGTQIEEPIENHLLGVDLELELVSGTGGSSHALYDVAINTELGSTDAKLVEGERNIEQVVLSRLITEQGTDVLYKHVGLKRIVGLNFVVSDLANAQYRIRESITADPRISSLQNLQFGDSDDKLETSMEAVLRGFSETRPINVAL
jgi:hypothetical protein